jgi:hypothetical protein
VVRLRRWPAVLLPAAVALVAASSVGSYEPPFTATVRPVDAVRATRMTGVSWRPGCPVELRELRVLRLRHRDFVGRSRIGTLIAHRDVSARLVRVFRRLYRSGVPIRRMTPIDAYGGSDFRSIEADNTSAFNCRFVDGTTRWSEHAYGRAIDVNPIENPYVTSDGRVSHRASRPYIRRTPVQPGMAVAGGPLVAAFDAEGFGWGGRWHGARDYQHFSASGR